MKTLIVLLLWLPVAVIAQPMDTLQVMKEIDSLMELSGDLTDTRKFDEAILKGKASLELCLAKLGETDEFCAFSMFNLGRVYHYMSDYDEALKYYEDSRVLRAKTIGKKHSDYGKTLTNQADVYFKKGDFEISEQLQLEAREIMLENVGNRHLSYSNSLTNLGVLYRYMGRYEEAEPLMVEALDIREEVYGKEHPIYAQSLTNLAIQYWAINDFERAEPLYFAAIEIFGKVLGEEHPYYATSLMNLSLLYSRMGRLEEAETALLKTLEIQGATIGKAHPSYAVSAFNMGDVYYNQGRLEDAALRYNDAKAIWEATKGEENNQYAACLNALANIHVEKGEFAIAETLLLEGQEIRKNSLGAKHPEYANSLMALFHLYQKTGRLAEAEAALKESLGILQNSLGIEHMDYINNEVLLADLYIQKGAIDLAKPYYGNAVKRHKKYLTKAARFLSERELQQYIQTFNKDLDGYFSLVDHQSDSLSQIEYIESAYDHSLFYKGFLLSAVNSLRQLAGKEETTKQKYNLLLSYKRKLLEEMSKPIEERTKVETLESKANVVEKELARSISGLDQRLKQVTWKEVQQQLNLNEAAIEFVHYKYYTPEYTDSIFYAAMLLLPNESAPRFIPLFEERALADLLVADGANRIDNINKIYGTTGRGAVDIMQDYSLYDIIWSKVEHEIKDKEVKTIYFSPTGLLHRLNLQAIPTSDAAILAERYKMIQLGSTGQLVNVGRKATENQLAILYGGIEFNIDTTALATTNKNKYASTSRGSDFLSVAPLNESTRGEQWGFLKWTAVEVSSLKVILSSVSSEVKVRNNIRATEESFKEMDKAAASPRILHIATHGFFYPDPQNKEVADRTAKKQMDGVVFKMADHPMMRSGLIFAGGNYAWTNGKPYLPDMEDGILTAYEISQMDLSDTELVVLSACETGLGDIQGHEGVYGMQRAFKMAGVKSLIMSLWQVPDFQTQELMTSFYIEWLQNGQSIAAALYTAQQEMREKYQDPYFWAGFVLVE